MHNRSWVLPSLAVVALAHAGMTASGAILTFTNKAAFLAAIAPSPTVVTFEGADTSGGSPGYTAYGAGANYGPGNVLKQTSGTFYAVTTGFGATNSDGDTNVVFDGNSGGALAINGTFSAIGFDVMNLNPPTPNVFSLSYSGGAGTTGNISVSGAPTADNPPPAFFGAIGTAGEEFTQFVAPPGNTPYFDNVILGTAVPEPAALGAIALGMVGLLRRR